ncbi:MAG: ECF-type sigma factor [Acidobacteriota bacterium]
MIVADTKPSSTSSAAGRDTLHWPLVYDELKSVARRQLRSGGGSLNPTALVHEAYMRLADDAEVRRRGRPYFFGAAAQTMRQVVIDMARKHQRAKRGGGEKPLTLKTGDLEVDGLATDVIDVHRALERLEALDPRKVQVVECRFFAGLDVNDTAEVLGISARTVKRDWMLARAWLARELESSEA